MPDDNNLVSMLDLEQDTEELMGFNPETDANASLPPVPAATYAVKVRFAVEDPEKRWAKGIWGKDNQTTYYTALACEIYNAAELDGRVVREQVSTYTMQRSGTNSVQGVLQALGYGEELKTCKTRSQLVLLLNDALEGDKAAGEAEVDWEASESLSEEERAEYKAKNKKQWRIQGMTRFPDPKKDGQYLPVINHEGVDCRAYNVIKRWITPKVGQAGVGTVTQAPVAAAPKPAMASSAPTARQTAQAPRAASQATVGGPPVPARAGVRK